MHTSHAVQPSPLIDSGHSRPDAPWPLQLFGGPVGAAITGLDARLPLSPSAAAQLKAVLAERGVVVLPGQVLDAAQQVAFSASLGPIESFYDQSAFGNSNLHIFRISNQGDGLDVGHYWHMDASTRARPTAISTLYAVEVGGAPPTDTRFLSAGQAYAGLSPAQRVRLAGLQWILADRISAPVLRAHPVTGKPLLWLPMRFPAKAGSDEELHVVLQRLNSDIRPRFDGLDAAQSNSLLLELVRHLTSQPAWVYRHTWRPGDLVVWDQSAVYHHAGDSGERRVLHRTAVRGEAAVGYSAGE